MLMTVLLSCKSAVVWSSEWLNEIWNTVSSVSKVCAQIMKSVLITTSNHASFSASPISDYLLRLHNRQKTQHQANEHHCAVSIEDLVCIPRPSANVIKHLCTERKQHRRLSSADDIYIEHCILLSWSNGDCYISFTNNEASANTHPCTSSTMQQRSTQHALMISIIRIAPFCQTYTMFRFNLVSKWHHSYCFKMVLLFYVLFRYLFFPIGVCAHEGG